MRGTVEEAADTFFSIIRERRLRGGSGCIKGKYQCVCFSEAPLSKLSHILANPSPHGMRYKPFGVMLDKAWLYEKGGRPVIYQSDEEYALLHEEQQFRHARYEPGRVDYTWEREWRIKTKKLALDLAEATLIVPNRAWEKWALRKHTAELSGQPRVKGGTGLKSLTEFPWHFVVLEDLGVDFPDVPLPPVNQPIAKRVIL